MQTLVRQTKIRCERDPREHPFHCHHEKTIVIDGRLAFVGGIDMTDLGGDRNDSSAHPARRRLGWHDVATRLQGPAVADVRDHFALRWKEVTGETLPGGPPPGPAGEHTVQVVRTVAEDMYERVPSGDFRILESYLRALRGAERYIYLENQFLWAPEIVDALADKLREPPGDAFRIVIVLPSKANNGQDDTRGQLGVLAGADGGAGRLLAATLRSRTGGRDDPLYVHAKVGIVDDRWLTIGSANLNAHSLLNDTEMNVVCDDPELARATRLALWAEHLETEVAAIAGQSPQAVVDEHFKPIATEQLRRRREGLAPDPPAARAPRRLPAVPAAARTAAGTGRRRLISGAAAPTRTPAAPGRRCCGPGWRRSRAGRCRRRRPGPAGSRRCSVARRWLPRPRGCAPAGSRTGTADRRSSRAGRPRSR